MTSILFTQWATYVYLAFLTASVVAACWPARKSLSRHRLQYQDQDALQTAAFWRVGLPSNRITATRERVGSAR